MINKETPAMDPELQFDRADYSHGGNEPACSTCQKPAAPEYYQLNGRVFCDACRRQIEASIERLHASGSFWRAALYGLGAAVLGSSIFYVVLSFGVRIGFVAL